MSKKLIKIFGWIAVVLFLISVVRYLLGQAPLTFRTFLEVLSSYEYRMPAISSWLEQLEGTLSFIEEFRLAFENGFDILQFLRAIWQTLTKGFYMIALFGYFIVAVFLDTVLLVHNIFELFFSLLGVVSL